MKTRDIEVDVLPYDGKWRLPTVLSYSVIYVFMKYVNVYVELIINGVGTVETFKGNIELGNQTFSPW